MKLNFRKALAALLEKPAPPPPYDFVEAVLERVIADLYYFPPLSVILAMHHMCEELAAMEPDKHQILEEKTAQGFLDVFGMMPRAMRISRPKFLDEFAKFRDDPHGYTDRIRYTTSLHLYDVIPKLGQAVLDLSGPFFAQEIRDKGLLPALRKQLLENENLASGIDSQDRRKGKGIIGADESKGSPLEIVATYLRNTPLLPFFLTQIPLQIDDETFASHSIIVAPPRHGKTQLLGNFAYDFIQRDDPPGLFVLDPHGDLFTKLSKLDVFHPEHGRLRDRLVILDPDTNPPALNFLDMGNTTEEAAYETFDYLVNSLSGGLSDKQSALATYLPKLLGVMPNPSIETLRMIMGDKAKSLEKSDLREYVLRLDPVDQGFFETQFFGGRSDETKQAIGWKLYHVLGTRAFREMFSAPYNSFDAYEAMQQKKIVLVKGGKQSLREQGMKVFLQFIIAQFYAASFRRDAIPEKDRHLCMLIIDEAHHVFNDMTGNILTECRKYGLGWLGATQVLEQIPKEVKAAIYGATAIKVAGPVAHSDAVQLGNEMYCTTEFIRNMKAVNRSHADFALYARGLTDNGGVKVRVPYGTLENAPQMDTTTHERMMAPKPRKAPGINPTPSDAAPTPGRTDPPSVPGDDASKKTW